LIEEPSWGRREGTPATSPWTIEVRFEDSVCRGVFWEREVGGGVGEPSIGDGIAAVVVWNRQSSDEEVSVLAVTYVG
jgi:hypothetical protein